MRREIRFRGTRGAVALIKSSEASVEERHRAMRPALGVNRVWSALLPLSSRARFPGPLLDLVLNSRPVSPGRAPHPHEFRNALSRQISRGALIVVEIPNPIGHGVAPPPTTVAAPPPEPVKTDELTWVEVVLLDEAGTPMAGQKCKVELPDGSTREVTLDDNGAFRVDDIPPGMCQVSFPEVPVNATAGG